MPFTKFTNLDFDQIRSQIKDYLRANSTFTDFDFEGSNFSVLIDTLAYNTYITAYNSNMIVNESFLDSATLRENVVSLARNIGYVPRSRSAAKANVSFNVQTTSTSPTMTLEAGLVCVGRANESQFIFSIPEDITTTISSGTASFKDIDIIQGTLAKALPGIKQAGSMTNVRQMEAEEYARDIGMAFDISRQQQKRSQAIARAKNRQMERAAKNFGVR